MKPKIRQKGVLTMKKKCFILSLLLFLGIILLFVIYKNNHYSKSKDTIAVYMNDELTTNIPTKENSSFVKANCDSDVNYYWDNANWGLFLKNINKKTKCNLYFKSKDNIKIAEKSFVVDEYTKCPQKYFNNDYNITELEDEYGYFCETDDDFGTSYYYRGVGTNNNVYFGGFYWQLIRINGDGSIRLLYNGNVKNAENENKTIGKSSYNSISSEIKHVGYMYGKNSDTYENSIKNEINSTIKEKIDAWYSTNLANTAFEKYIADSGFCNDRTLYSGDGVTSATFNGYNRLITNKNPTLLCKNSDNDLFTTINSNIGNKALTYPIGIMTADETLFAGVINYTSLNKNSYLFSNNWYWAMTPMVYQYAEWSNSNLARVYSVGLDEQTTLITVANNSYYIRPVINIKGNILNKGDGSVDNPFRIE